MSEGQLRPSPDAADEIAVAREAARNTFNKSKRVNLRMTERDFNLAHSRAREEGVPYQTLSVQRHPQVPVWKIDGEEDSGDDGFGAGRRGALNEDSETPTNQRGTLKLKLPRTGRPGDYDV